MLRSSGIPESNVIKIDAVLDIDIFYTLIEIFWWVNQRFAVYDVNDFFTRYLGAHHRRQQLSDLDKGKNHNHQGLVACKDLCYSCNFILVWIFNFRINEEKANGERVCRETNQDAVEGTLWNTHTDCWTCRSLVGRIAEFFILSKFLFLFTEGDNEFHRAQNLFCEGTKRSSHFHLFHDIFHDTFADAREDTKDARGISQEGQRIVGVVSKGDHQTTEEQA